MEIMKCIKFNSSTWRDIVCLIRILYITIWDIIHQSNQIYLRQKKEHNATQKNKANMSTGHKGSMKLH